MTSLQQLCAYRSPNHVHVGRVSSIWLFILFFLAVSASCSASDPTDFGSAAIGDDQQSVHFVPFSIASSAVLTNIRVVTQGATGQDFIDVGQGTCLIGHLYSAGDSCSVSVRFNALHFGLRKGAVQITDAIQGTQTIYIHGIGHGAQLVFTPGKNTTVAGSGTTGYRGDGHAATTALLDFPLGVATSNDFLYIADSLNNRIRRVDATGTITTIAGSGTYGFAGDEGPASIAELSAPSSVVIDGAGYVYILDSSNQRIRRIDQAGMITTICGTGQTGYNGDNIPAVNATIYSPEGIAVDGSGNLYVADTNNNRIRKIDPSGIISTIAGTGKAAYGGDDGPASQAYLQFPSAVSMDPSGNLYIADTINQRIRRVDTTDTITTIAGNGVAYYSGDGSLAIHATLSYPNGVYADPAGDIYIADTDNNCVREVTVDGVIRTVVGGPRSSPALSNPYAVTLGDDGRLFIADTYHALVRAIDYSPPSFNYGNQQPNTISAPQITTVTNPNPEPVLISGISISPGFFQSPIGANDCFPNLELLPGQQCVFGITFAPTSPDIVSAFAHLQTASLDGSSAEDAQIALSGIGTGPTAEQIRWIEPSPISFGTMLGSSELNAAVMDSSGGSVPGVYSYMPVIGTVLSAGDHTLSVTFTPSDARLASLSTEVILKVLQAVPSIHWSDSQPIVYGSALSASQLSAYATGTDGRLLPGTFSYSPVAGVKLPTGSTLLLVSFTPTDLIDYAVTADSTSVQVLRAQPVLRWIPPNPITYGSPLTAGQLDAGAIGIDGQPLAGTFIYSPTAGAVLSPGLHPLLVTFVPADGADYQSISQSTSIQVSQLATILTWPSPSPIVYGTPLSSLQLNAVVTADNGQPVGGTFSYSPPAGTMLTAGSHTVDLTFTPGSSAYASQAASATIIVTRAPSSLRIDASDPASSPGAVTLVARLANGPAPPTGTVMFANNQTTLASIPVLADGTATYLWNGSSAQSSVITASYTGDLNYLPSASNLSISAPAVPSFSLAADRQTVSIHRGEMTVVVLTLTPTNGFADTVALAVAGLPQYSTATLSSPSWRSNGSPTSITLTLDTEVNAAMNRSTQTKIVVAGCCPLIAICGGATLFLVRRRVNRTLWNACMVLTAAAASVTFVGCGATPFKAQNGSYDLVISATPASSSFRQQTTHIDLTVQ